MFSKILIANRGEIACRIIRTARSMGIATVAVYSEADAIAKHVKMADEAVCIGAAPARKSYLLADKIIGAAIKTGAQAIHPGYGFLSENSEFCQAQIKAGIAFIGPNEKAIRIMGDKIISKSYARQAGVDVIPGYDGEVRDLNHAKEIIADIGYPVMIKASAGGGGKGMRIAQHPKELEEAYVRAISEAKSSFADGRILIEKYIANPRHIEIQVLGDKHGNCISMLERECSIQRRNQKVIEEAPSPFLNQRTRDNMSAQALSLARSVGYDSAGTVEFIIDAEKNFYFLEMNTRLQVEHPVTELITGIDIVEQMINIAAGKQLKLQQSDIKANGWAIEARLYCEDPCRDFLPSSGRIKYYVMPEQKMMDEDVKLRIDDGMYEGAEMTVFYDPMIAKLSVHAKNRAKAIASMSQVLNSCYIEGVSHNIAFLSAVMRNEQFINGNINTQFIAQQYPNGFSGTDLTSDETLFMALIATHVDYVHNFRRFEIRGRITSAYFNMNRVAIFSNTEEFSFHTKPIGKNIIDFIMKSANKPHKSGKQQDITKSRFTVETDWRPGQLFWKGKIDGKFFCVAVKKTGSDCYQLGYMGSLQSVWVYSENEAIYARLMPAKKEAEVDNTIVRCPMPGVVVEIMVKENQYLQQNEPICSIEAMKMENVIKTVVKGKVKKIHCSLGDKLSRDDLIITLDV